MNPPTVTVHPRTGPAVAAVAATLPVTFRHVNGEDVPDLAVVPGDRAWPDAARVALARGSRAVLVVHPQPTSAAADGLDAVLLDTPWASGAAMPAAADHLRTLTEDPNEHPLLECRIVVPPGRPLGAHLVDAATLVRHLLGPLTDLSLRSHDAHGLIAVGVSAGRPVSVSVLRTTALPPHAHVRLLGLRGAVAVSLPDPASGRPAEVEVLDPHGALTLPTTWESAHRSAWRRAHDVLQTSGTGAVRVNDVADFLHDQSVTEEALCALAS